MAFHILYFGTAITFLCCLRTSSCYNVSEFGIDIGFNPKAMAAILEEAQEEVNYIITSTNNDRNLGFYKMIFKMDDDFYAEFIGEEIVFFHDVRKNPLLFGNFTVKGKSFGYTKINIIVEDTSSSNLPNKSAEMYYFVTVIRNYRIIDDIFPILIVTIMIFGHFLTGANIEFDVIKDNLKNPLVVVIAISCKLIIMPVVAFGVITLLDIPGSIGLGIFIFGCCPSSMGSSMFIHLLDGSISISVMANLIGTVVSLVLTPMWTLTLGSYIMGKENIDDFNIPFLDTYLVLFLAMIPLLFGILFKKIKPDWVAKTAKHLKKCFLVLLLLAFGLGLASYYFVFKLFTLKIVFAGCLLPYIGFLIGGIVPALLKQPLENCVTIGIMTGHQNLTIGMSLILLPLEQPEQDLAMVGAAVILCFQSLPLYTSVAVITIKEKIKNKVEDNKQKKYDDSCDIKQNEKNTLTESDRLVK